MAKGKDTKKKNWKLRRQLRKTLGCLFMISAIIVTTIPVQPIEAAPLPDWITTDNASTSRIPTITPADTIYQTGDSNFQFAYVGTGSDKYAVILGFNEEQSLDGGKLAIPNEIDAYVKYSDTEGTARGYAASGKDGSPLFYAVYRTEIEIDYRDVIQTDGSVKKEAYEVTKQVIDSYRPCYYEDYSVWHNVADKQDVQLYYHDGTGYQVIGSEQARIKDAIVKYIGNQTVDYDHANMEWKLGDKSSPVKGVFGGTGTATSSPANQIRYLTVGKDLLGIGKYAFYSCANLSSITFGNGLNTIESYAFANCGSLSIVNMPTESNLTLLGDHAFANCGMLQRFDVPTAMQAIGDSSFENCSSLVEFNIIPKDGIGASNLTAIGYNAFKNCSSLQELVLPKSFTGEWKGDNLNKFHLSTVRGCTSLKRITTYSDTLDFISIEAEAYTFANFKNDVGKTFYFEAPGYKQGTNNQTKSAAHITANKEHIAFKYLGEDKYEIVEVEKSAGDTPTNVDVIYAVNSSGELITFAIESNKKVPSITMPEQIGPYGITAIQDGSFSDNCWIEKVTIPATVLNIYKGAFRGCHNLRDVIFTNAKNVIMIEDGAFATQTVRTTSPAHLAGDAGKANGFCGDNSFLYVSEDDPDEEDPDEEDTDKNDSGQPYLSFSGDIVNGSGINTVPFKYAMKEANKINVTTQRDSYITYFSGWPTNLTVRYNMVKKQPELISYPTMEDLTNSYVRDGKDMFPYLTTDRKSAAATALARYNEWIGGGKQPTNEQIAIVDAVYNMVIPNGVSY